MNRPKLKLVGGIALLAVLGVLFGGFLLLTNAIVNGVYNLDMQSAKMKAINSSVGSILDLNAYVESREVEKFTNRAALTSVAARGVIENDWDGKSSDYNNGAIVTVSGGKIKYPENYPEEQKIDASSLTDSFGMVPVDVQKDTETDVPNDAWLVEYYKIGDDVYYIESELKSSLEETARRSFDAAARMKGIEDAFDIQVLLISQEEGEDGNHALLYNSGALTEGTTAEQCGITKEMLETALENTQQMTAEKLLETSGNMKLDGTSYRTFVQTAKGSDFSGETVFLAYLIPEDEFITMTVEQTVVVLAAFLILGIVLLVWFFSLFGIVRLYRLNEEQAMMLGVKSTLKKAFARIAVGCILILLIAALVLSLFRLFGVCNSVKKSLKVLEQRIEENKVQEKTTVDELKNSYLSYAERIAGILKERPEFATKEGLQTFSDMIGADYIMLYDHDGYEMASSSNYVDMELGTSPDSSTYEFRRLLKGIPSVVHDVKKDEETGLTNALIGVCQEYPGESEEQYGALLIAVPPNKLIPENLETMDDVMKSIVASGTVSFSVNPEDQTIVNASDLNMVGRNAVSMDLPQSALTDSYRDFFSIDGTSCYGESKDIEGLLYYYAAEQPHIYKNVLLYSVIAAGAAFLFMSVIIGYMMFGYRKGFEHWSKIGDDLEERISDGNDPDNDSEQQEDPRKRWKLSLSKFGLRTPAHNASVTLEILLVGSIIGIGVWYMLRGESATGSLLGFVMHGQWTKGLNLFSITSILLLFAEVLIVVSILKILVRITCSSMGPKGETFCRLGLNLLTYAGMVFFVYMALYNLGINLGALIASLSLPAFALSLGAKDLITDIVAGISIVFDGEFRVGDIIDIGGYRGTVLEIGVRTTKLQGAGNNIKTIANRDVKNVINMSRKTSYCNLEVRISTFYNRLKDVEAMLKEQLPKLEGTIPGVISGPFYRGVNEIGDKTVTLSFSTECEQKDFNKVKKALNHAIQEIFDEQGIMVR